MIDSILENERKIQKELSFATRNIFKFQEMRGIVFKLSLVWIGKVFKALQSLQKNLVLILIHYLVKSSRSIEFLGRYWNFLTQYISRLVNKTNRFVFSRSLKNKLGQKIAFPAQNMKESTRREAYCYESRSFHMFWPPIVLNCQNCYRFKSLNICWEFNFP